MKNLITFRNKKLKNDKIGAFKLPAGKTCPFAGECKTWCYAKVGTYRFPCVKNFSEESLKATKQDNFCDRMIGEIRMRKDKGMYALRLHTAGDFYSQEYFDKWLAIAYAMPDVLIYTYTKSFPFIRWDYLPDNFVIIESEGGTIPADKRRKHAVVFMDYESAHDAGYMVCDTSELVVFSTNKIGLIAHGANKNLVGSI